MGLKLVLGLGGRDDVAFLGLRGHEEEMIRKGRGAQVAPSCCLMRDTLQWSLHVA